jgi:hypothetical protein
MRGSEQTYGYVVACVLLIVAVLNFTANHGKGAPKHPQTALMVVGVAAAVILFGLVTTRNRMVGGFGAIIAAFFVTVPQAGSSLQLAHILALVIPLAYALIITQRQRKLATAELKARGGRSRSSDPGRPRAGRRRKSQPEEPVGPKPSRRYTPPKSKGPSGKAAGRR